MTLTIPFPHKTLCDTDAHIECESVIDLPVSELIELIVEAGWPPKAVSTASHLALRALSKDELLQAEFEPAFLRAIANPTGLKILMLFGRGVCAPLIFQLQRSETDPRRSNELTEEYLTSSL